MLYIIVSLLAVPEDFFFMIAYPWTWSDSMTLILLFKNLLTRTFYILNCLPWKEIYPPNQFLKEYLSKCGPRLHIIESVSQNSIQTY
jgi:hypothetical protein